LLPAERLLRRGPLHVARPDEDSPQGPTRVA
jgi:hypothetical protein